MISRDLPPDLDAVGNYRLLRLLAEISTNLVALPLERLSATIEGSLQLIVETLDLDRSTLWQLADDRAGLILTHCWQRTGTPVPPTHFDCSRNYPWLHGKLLRGETTHFTRLDELPAEAAIDVANFRRQGLKSKSTIPLMAGGEVFGAIAFGMLSSEHRWTLDEIDALGLVARIVSNVIARQRAEHRAEQLRDELARVFRASMLGEFATGLAHELNQPLAAILGNAQAARRFLANGTADPTELSAILDDIIRDDKRASEVILNLRKLLDGSTSAGEVCDLNDLVLEVWGFLSKSLIHGNITVKLAPTRLEARVVRVEIQQVLVNLILNSIQAMAAMPPRSHPIRVETVQEGGHARISVTDHGCGFPPDQQERLFDPFHSTKPRGLGMGLAICRRIVDAHGGRIGARNGESGGAVFSFSLPLRGR